MSNSKRLNIFLFCENCKSRNYSSSRGVEKTQPENKKNGKISLKKFCKRCCSKVVHKEIVKK